jgi:phosphoglucosamine mutase
MKYFGTDGIRGLVGKYPITVDFILKLGWAIGSMLVNQKKDAKVLIAKDTRISGYMIESALQAGLSSAGAHIYLLGPLPTSAVAYMTQTLRADIGIVISASHNPFDDNGIKFFSSEGYKLSTYYENLIETQLQQDIITSSSIHLGKAKRIDDAQGRYIEFCKRSVPHRTNLNHLKIVIDCANGATYHIAPFVFRELGAEVIELHAEPDGYNINEQCGAMYPHVVQQAVILEKADVGIAFDGDGDRLVMIDHTGEILDGDELIYIVLKGLIEAKLFSGGIVGTQMTNMNLELALQEMHIPFQRVAVGDQYVIHELKEKNWILGGEPSGHIIYLNTTTTADGIITALQVLQSMQTLNKNLHELRNTIKKFPQKIINISYEGVKVSLSHPKIEKIIHHAEEKLGTHGRVLLRYSGTEPVIRLMLEGENFELINHLADEICSTVKELIGNT